MSRASLAERLRARVDRIVMSACDGCDACGLRCAEGVRMSRAEYEAVRDWVARSADRDDVTRVERQAKDVALGDGVHVRMCRFRDVERGRCAIYPVRPTICRLFGHVEWLPCPIGQVGPTIPAAEVTAMGHDAAPEERRTFEEWEAAPDAGPGLDAQPGRRTGHAPTTVDGRGGPRVGPAGLRRA